MTPLDVDVTRQFNDLLREFAPELFASGPRFHYWTHTTESGRVRWPTRYAWTIERTKGAHHDDVGFYAMEYRRIWHDKNGESWKMVREVRFGRKKVAKARAWSWFVRDCRHANVGQSGPPEKRTAHCKTCSTELPVTPAAPLSPFQ